MLFPRETFEKFAGNKSTDANESCETLLSFDAESQEEVDALHTRLINAGAFIFGEPGWVDGWMYGLGFSDPDGHRWNMLYMNR